MSTPLDQAGQVWMPMNVWSEVPGSDFEIALLDTDQARHNDDGVAEYPTRYRRVPAPVGGEPNLHVALANTLKMRTQESDATLIAGVEKLQARIAELEGQIAHDEQGRLVRKNSYPCGCFIVDPGGSARTHHNENCAMGHIKGAL